MIDPKALEAAARALAEHFGPPMSQLPKDKVARKKKWQRDGIDPGHTQDDVNAATLAAITAYQQARREDGVVEVPREPTEAMLVAAMSRECSGDMYFSIYRAMIAAHEGENQ